MIRGAAAALVVALTVWASSLQAAPGTAASQVERLLADRPHIVRTLTHRSHVRRWIAQRFLETKPPLVWDPTMPVSDRGGEFDARDPKLTRLRISPDASGIDQLSTLIFELHNVMGYEVFKEVHDRAVAGSLSREAYARAMLQQEIVALNATRDYLAAHVATLTAEEKRTARRYFRYRYGPATMEGRIAEARRQGIDLLDHYRKLYDTIVVRERN